MGLRHLNTIGVIVTRQFWAVTDAIMAVHVDVAKLILQSALISSSSQSQNDERWKN